MSSRRHLSDAALALAFAVVLGGCAATTEGIVASASLPPQHRVLDLRFTRVTIRHQRMQEALMKLDRDIRRQTSGKLVLPFEWHVGIRDPELSVRAHDISLRSLLELMCRQSGLTYEPGAPGIPPPGLYFDEPHEQFTTGPKS